MEVYLERARAQGVRITHVLETHIHADFVSGSRELADRTGAEICLSDEEAAYGFAHRGLEDGDALTIGRVRLRVLHTPGHTPEHVCFVVSGGAGAEQPWGVFTGDTLFAGEVGRPDLLGEESAGPLARRLFRSIHGVLLPLGDGLEVLPAHGKGSPCGARIGDRKRSTLGYERLHNPRLQTRNAEAFIREVLDTAPEAPTYYPRMKRLNAGGPKVLGCLPTVQPLDAEAFARELEREGTLVLDAREIEAWGGAHIEGSLNIALREAFPIWAGWLLPPDRRILLVVERASDVDAIQRHLLRIGVERLAGYLGGGFRAWTGAGRPFRRAPQMSVHELRDRVQREPGALQVVDVRSDAEWEHGRVPGATHAHLPRLEERLDGLDRRRPTAVYCGSGYRASMAASLLERAGFDEVRNVPGSMAAWTAAGYPLEGASDDA
ncbi:MAG: MBL fold metallo-hydrolase [Gammaproteobacteria bacterium]|nr:MBL fold metallo-hydrolase [Gemmatimonadota bacterium]NIU74542.1 MBL fold metallo-hydrolase [Gammaproteobacteria bacterium]NIY08711.1 MBL fold metallo-hydrolase [Gemmatimonadota bacterium]